MSLRGSNEAVSRMETSVAQLVYHNWLKLVYIGQNSDIASELVLDAKYRSNWFLSTRALLSCDRNSLRSLALSAGPDPT